MPPEAPPLAQTAATAQELQRQANTWLVISLASLALLVLWATGNG